eukprot:TRINITY_DN3196_c0_g1_i1.p1 TRINITY_DN3196_c0_g1~~TRINITY_DN3196_c0_g1_i1.p1  ORF type:complete len:193 (+),score=35.19 TRINITY_DN3196_c0_g1_i1:364-942(+)
MAIDLTWDIIVRFISENNEGLTLPKEFFDDWLRVATEESKHYKSLAKRLKEIGSHYGAYPAHDGLWESARDTMHSLLYRLCIEHMVHEARGIDVAPNTANRFRSGGDKGTADLLDVIHQDEITHVTNGMKWFKYVCTHSNPPKDPIETFHTIVREKFRGGLKPPFNHADRQKAGMTEEWYLPLVKQQTTTEK